MYAMHAHWNDTNAIISSSNRLPSIMSYNEYVKFMRNDSHISIPYFIYIYYVQYNTSL